MKARGLVMQGRQGVEVLGHAQYYADWVALQDCGCNRVKSSPMQGRQPVGVTVNMRAVLVEGLMWSLGHAEHLANREAV